MFKATPRVNRFTMAVALCISTTLILCAPSRAGAQVLRGIARTIDAAKPVERAQVFALDRNGKAIGNAVTDENGRFFLKVSSRGNPFTVSVRRIGMQPMSSEPMMLASIDTLEADFLLTEVGIVTDTVRVTAPQSFNDIKLAEAKRRGWRVFSPKLIAERRESVTDFSQLIRGLGYPGLVVGSRPQDCIRSTRNNGCMTIVMDGVPMSAGNPLINPRDIYFLAVLTASDAVVQYGDRAPWGAIVVYTRMRGDKLQ